MEGKGREEEMDVGSLKKNRSNKIKKVGEEMNSVWGVCVCMHMYVYVSTCESVCVGG